MPQLLPETFHVVKADETTAVASFTLPADLLWFKGHFPGFALLPGLAQLYFLQETLRQGFGAELAIASLPQLKFMHPLLPGQAGELKVQRKAGSEGRFTFELYALQPDKAGKGEKSEHSEPKLLCARGSVSVC